MTYYTTVNSGYYNNGHGLTGTYSDYDYLDQYSSTGTTSTWIPYTQTSTTAPYTQTYTQILGSYIPIRYSREVDYKPSEQELSRHKEERIKAEEAAKKAREEAEEAERKARLLLTEYLDNENMKRLLNKEPLEVPSRLFGDIKYQIPISNGRIKAWKENNVVTELCLAVKESGCLPMDDIILTKLLHVLHDEENMLRTANHFNTKENLLARLN